MSPYSIANYDHLTLGIDVFSLKILVNPARNRRSSRKARPWRSGRACNAFGLALAFIRWQMNDPYAMQWLGLLGGFRGVAPVDPAYPLRYLYGERKPLMFHSPQWLALVAARPGCAVRRFRSSHWVMVDQPEALNPCVGDWLAGVRG